MKTTSTYTDQGKKIQRVTKTNARETTNERNTYKKVFITNLGLFYNQDLTFHCLLVCTVSSILHSVIYNTALYHFWK